MDEQLRKVFNVWWSENADKIEDWQIAIEDAFVAGRKAGLEEAAQFLKERAHIFDSYSIANALAEAAQFIQEGKTK